MSNKTRLPITAWVVLPFRANIRPLRTSFVVSGDDISTAFQLNYGNVIHLTPKHVVNASAWTQVTLETQFISPGPVLDTVEHWFMLGRNGAGIIEDEVIPRLNEFLLRLRHSSKYDSGTNVLRSVGSLDLVFANLLFRGEVVLSRSNSTFVGSMGEGTIPPVEIDTQLMNEPIPHEWAVIVRSCDLVNHGYHLEGLIVAFALLDSSVSTLVAQHLTAKGLNQREANELLRSIESERLKRYLTLLLPLAGYHSPLTETGLASDLAWLNTTRNKIMHAGERCTLEKAQRAIQVVRAVLIALNSCGGKFRLPEKLPFW